MSLGMGFLEETWIWRVAPCMAPSPVAVCQLLPCSGISLWHLHLLIFFFPCLQRQVEVNVRNKILYLIQAWAHAFRNEPKYKVVQDTYQIMKVEGESRGWGQEGPVPGLGHTIRS